MELIFYNIDISKGYKNNKYPDNLNYLFSYRQLINKNIDLSQFKNNYRFLECSAPFFDKKNEPDFILSDFLSVVSNYKFHFFMIPDDKNKNQNIENGKIIIKEMINLKMRSYPILYINTDYTMADLERIYKNGIRHVFFSDKQITNESLFKWIIENKGFINKFSYHLGGAGLKSYSDLKNRFFFSCDIAKFQFTLYNKKKQNTPIEKLLIDYNEKFINKINSLEE